MRLNRQPNNIISVSLYSLDKDAIAFFKKQGYELTHSGKTFGWAGRIKEEDYWELVRQAYEAGYAVMLVTRTLPASDKEGNLPIYCIRLDSNMWSFRQH